MRWGLRKAPARQEAEAACRASDEMSTILKGAIADSCVASQKILERFIRRDEDEKNRGGSE